MTPGDIEVIWALSFLAFHAFLMIHIAQRRERRDTAKKIADLSETSMALYTGTDVAHAIRREYGLYR